jgi:hypothetical protein
MQMNITLMKQTLIEKPGVEGIAYMVTVLCDPYIAYMVTVLCDPYIKLQIHFSVIPNTVSI